MQFRLAMGLALSLWGQAAIAEPISINEIETYIEALDEVAADFTQINSDGSINTGRLMIDRPGKMRFDYSEPNRSLIIAVRGTISVFDHKSNRPPVRYPTSRTPLGVILSRDVDLSGSSMISDFRNDGEITNIEARDRRRPKSGKILMSFSDNPVTLRSWMVTSEQGEETTVILNNIERNAPVNPLDFSVNHEMRLRGISR